MRFISNPKDLEPAWNQQYERLAKKVASMLPRKGGVLVDIGCGTGQLTIPLVKRIPRYQAIALDNFRGPYADNREKLLSAITKGRMKARIKPVTNDYEAWLNTQLGSKYDGIISSEFLPEIDSQGMRGFFAECYRVVKPGGFMVHSFLSPQPRNVRQKRLIEADSDSRWTKTPPIEWFSPPREMALEYLKLAGFRGPRQVRMKSGPVIRSNAAKKLLKDWDVRQSYWTSHRDELEKEGLEIPGWLIISGVKQ